MLIGAAAANITPSEQIDLAGYGYFLERRTSDIESGLTATALTFESPAGNRAAICSLDLLSVDEATVSKVGAAVAELSPHMAGNTTLLINASHAHSGPATRRMIGVGEYNPTYVDNILVPRLAQTVARA